jgi:hypothetical protein
MPAGKLETVPFPKTLTASVTDVGVGVGVGRREDFCEAGPPPHPAIASESKNTRRFINHRQE